MKKIFLLFSVIFTMSYSGTLFAGEKVDEILIKTIDNTEAINLFKELISGNSGMLSRNGFGSNSKIGTPFSVEYQGADSYLFSYN